MIRRTNAGRAAGLLLAALPLALQIAAEARQAASPPSSASVGTPTPTPATAVAPAYVITPEQRAFWSFQPVHATPAPAVSHTSWPKGDIDRFVLARLEKAGLAPVNAADKRTLIRRAT